MSKILNILKIAVIVLIAISYVVMTHEGLNNVYSSQNTTNNSIDVVNDSINDQIIFANMDTHKNLSYNLPNKPTYILRLDDMQSPAWSDISMKIINDALSRNMSISVAVIPNSDNLDPRGTIEFIREHKDNPRFEIVQHGFAHSRYEYANLSANETRSTTTRGLRKIYQDYNIYPVTFIPPCNGLSNNTPEVLGNMGFKIISTVGDIRYEGNILDVGSNVATKCDETLNNPEKIISGCEEDFRKQNLSVIMIHPQDYVSGDRKTLDTVKYANYLEMLNELNDTKAQSITFRDLLK